MSIHPGSALLGAVLLALVLLATSAFQAPAFQSTGGNSAASDTAGVKVDGIPGPRDVFLVRERDISSELGLPPYIVPAGKLLVMTGMGSFSAGNRVHLVVDGEDLAISPTTVGIVTLPPHVTAQAGSTVEIGDYNGNTQTGFFYGYLVNS